MHCSKNSNHVCFIIPSVIMEKILLEGTHEQKEKILYTYGLSKRVRGYRRSVKKRRPQLLSSGTFNKHRMVYDMDHSDDDNQLPGSLLINENEKDGGNSEATNAYKNTGITFDFYKEVFERNSIDGNGNILISSVDYGGQYDNAFWNGEQMVFGNGGGGMIKENTLTSAINVIAHELTHGVTQYTANLAGEEEPGGLNESMSDIFGIMCEQWSKKQTVSQSNWLIGEGIMEKGTALRDMKGEQKVNPWDESVFSYKDYRKELDVHFSAGIPNKAFYVTAKEIGGNSWEKAGKIWYIVLTQGWLSSNGPPGNGIYGKSFQETADGTFTVAGQLYGDGSEEQNAVKEGWTSVDIKPQKDVKPIIAAMNRFK
jgi:Zn-dependent metalloprotease